MAALPAAHHDELALRLRVRLKGDALVGDDGPDAVHAALILELGREEGEEEAY